MPSVHVYIPETSYLELSSRAKHEGISAARYARFLIMKALKDEV